MKNNLISKIWQASARVVSAKIVALAVLATALVFVQLASAQTAYAGGEPRCSLATLKGQYSWVGNGYQKFPDQNDPTKTVTVPSSSIALLTLDGSGNFNLLITVVFDGNVVHENHRVSDTYVVNSDCTGVLGSGIQGPKFDILVPRDGSSFLIIDINGGTAASEAKRLK